MAVPAKKGFFDAAKERISNFDARPACDKASMRRKINACNSKTPFFSLSDKDRPYPIQLPFGKKRENDAIRDLGKGDVTTRPTDSGTTVVPMDRMTRTLFGEMPRLEVVRFCRSQGLPIHE